MSLKMDFDKTINAQMLSTLKQSEENAYSLLKLVNKYGIYGYDATKFLTELYVYASQLGDEKAKIKLDALRNEKR